MYHGYSTPSGIKSANNIQVIELSLPHKISGTFGISESDQSIISGVIKQYLAQSETGSPSPYTISIQAYNDKNSPYANPQTVYGTQTTVNSQLQYNQASNYQQPNYYQQQQSSYDYNNYNYKQQQHQREVEIYEQKLREYYAKYPSVIPQPAMTTTSPPVSELVKPNEIKPTQHNPIPDDGKSLSELLLANLGFGREPPTNDQSLNDQNNQPSDGKSLLELINEEKSSTEGGKSLAELLGHQSTSTSTIAPKKSLDDLIGNVFIEKENSPTEAPPKVEGGKSLFELLADLSPLEPEVETELPSVKSTEQVKKNSDVAGGDYGLDVRTDDSKVKRTKRSILHEGLRRITDRISNFGKNVHERHTRDHECDHHEGRSHHSLHNHNHNRNNDEGENSKHNGRDAFIEDHRHDAHKGRHPFDNAGHGHEHPHPHPHFNPHPNYDQDEGSKHNHNEKPRPLNDNEEPFKKDSEHDQAIQPSRKPNSVDAGTQTDGIVTTKTDVDRDTTLDIDIRGGFSETRRKRHNVKRSRRSPEEEVVFQDDDDEMKPKVEEPIADVVEEEEKVTDPTPAEESDTTEKEGEDGEKGDLDSRFGFFGGGGGFNRQAGRRPIGNIIGGILSGVNGAYDPYNRAPPPGPYPYYPDPHGHHPPDYAQQQQLYGYGGNNYPPQPPPQQQPIHIHINNIANAQSEATNTASGPFGPLGSNQNAAANAQSQNLQNEFGSFQNSGAAGQSSNLAADGSSGQLSAANAMNQNYQNEFGSGSKNAAQSQSANFDNHGNLALTSSNSGTNHFAGPDGVRDETNSAAQSSLQGQFGTQNSGAQSNTYQGPNGSGSSASSQSSSINNGHGSQNSGANAAANSGNFGGNSFGNAQSGTYANDQWGW